MTSGFWSTRARSSWANLPSAPIRPSALYRPLTVPMSRGKAGMMIRPYSCASTTSLSPQRLKSSRVACGRLCVLPSHPTANPCSTTLSSIVSHPKSPSRRRGMPLRSNCLSHSSTVIAATASRCASTSASALIAGHLVSRGRTAFSTKTSILPGQGGSSCKTLFPIFRLCT